MGTNNENILRHHHHHHAPMICDLKLIHLLTYIWLGAILAVLSINSGIHFMRDHDLFPSFSSSFAPSLGADHAGDWTHLESHGDVELLYRTIIPTSGLHAHKAVVVADLPIEALIHVFRDTPNNVHWAKDLKEAEEYHKSGVHHNKDEDGNTEQVQTSTVRQRYNIPVPGFADRELVMHKKMTATENTDGTHSMVTYDFNSLTEDECTALDLTLCTGCVRAVNLGSKWTFTSLNSGTKTKIEAEMAMDPRTGPSLSNFFVNIFQKRWPQVSVHGLMNEARRHLGRDDEIQVANTFFRLFPLK